MATAIHSISDTDKDLPDSNVDRLLAAGDIEGARVEFERLCLESLDSGEAVAMTPEKWEQFRLELHHKASLLS